ncbi:MAG: hypothetical protein ACK42C_03395 [Aquificaceae bacterium]|jgi:flagellar biosynthesis chaperone FliJ|uniref:hypothetical protein n=1 Tax=Hydrogenobacter sp. Uz 6-8 TaxID=3384828 RepID=UPI0030A7F1F0
MALRRIIKLKEGIKEARARELREVQMQIEAIKEQIKALEGEAEAVNEKAKVSFSEGLLFQYRALMARKKELTEKLRELEVLREERKEKLKQAYRDVKALDILRVNRERESMVKNLNFEFQKAGFLHLIKHRLWNG